jgi:hypothetical protein
MIRLVCGAVMIFGAVGGMEVGDLNPITALMLAIPGLIAMWWVVLDGTINRLAKK